MFFDQVWGKGQHNERASKPVLMVTFLILSLTVVCVAPVDEGNLLWRQIHEEKLPPGSLNRLGHPKTAPIKSVSLFLQSGTTLHERQFRTLWDSLIDPGPKIL